MGTAGLEQCASWLFVWKFPFADIEIFSEAQRKRLERRALGCFPCMCRSGDSPTQTPSSLPRKFNLDVCKLFAANFFMRRFRQYSPKNLIRASQCMFYVHAFVPPPTLPHSRNSPPLPWRSGLWSEWGLSHSQLPPAARCRSPVPVICTGVISYRSAPHLWGRPGAAGVEPGN